MQSKHHAILFRSAIFGITVALLVSCWSVFETLLLDAIRSAYQMESIDILNNLISDRESYPLEHYLTKGRELSDNALIGAVAYLMVAFVVLTPGVFGTEDGSRKLRVQLQSST